MKTRDQDIIKALLTFLDQLDGAQAVEPLIHAAAQTHLRNLGLPAPSLAEFQASLLICDQRGWVRGTLAKTTGQMKWALTDMGKDALSDL